MKKYKEDNRQYIKHNVNPVLLFRQQIDCVSFATHLAACWFLRGVYCTLPPTHVTLVSRRGSSAHPHWCLPCFDTFPDTLLNPLQPLIILLCLRCVCVFIVGGTRRKELKVEPVTALRLICISNPNNPINAH